MKRGLLASACAALLVFVATAQPVSSAVPTKLVATWVAKNGNRMTLKKTGKAVLVYPGYERQTISVSVTGASITFGRTTLCVKGGRYSWALAGRVLTLKPVTDSCSLRRSFLRGAWTRR